jgi:precorrin-6Y C5,15-methyltransferase (decarboxylating)
MPIDPAPAPVVVVGIGADGPAGLVPAAAEALAEAEVVVGGRRQLDLLGPHSGELITWPTPMVPALPALFERLAGRRVCVLASGDPMFYGIGATLSRLLGPDRLRVIPHPSSVSLACARLGWPVQDVLVLSLVGRHPDALRAAMSTGRRLLVLVPDADGPGQVARLLVRQGYGGSELMVLEQLGGPGERRYGGTAGAWRHPRGDDLAVVAVHCRADPDTRELSRVPGLPDDAFEHDGQLTKREARAMALAQLAPRPGQLLWDVGAGAGSIGIEWMRAEEGCRAIAVEREPARAARIERNARALGVPDLGVVIGAAPEALAGLQEPAAVFVGGGVSAQGVLPACWAALSEGGRLVAHAVTLEAEAVLATWHARHGGTLTRVEIHRAAPIGRLTGWTPARPLTQWAVRKWPPPPPTHATGRLSAPAPPAGPAG